MFRIDIPTGHVRNHAISPAWRRPIQWIYVQVRLCRRFTFSENVQFAARMLFVHYRKRIKKIVMPLPGTHLANDADPESCCAMQGRFVEAGSVIPLWITRILASSIPSCRREPATASEMQTKHFNFCANQPKTLRY